MDAVGCYMESCTNMHAVQLSAAAGSIYPQLKNVQAARLTSMQKTHIVLQPQCGLLIKT